MFRAILRWIFLGAIYLFLALVVARALDINLFWDANSEPNVTHYNIYRGAAAGGPYETIGTSPQTPAPWFMADPSSDGSARYRNTGREKGAGSSPPW